MSSSLNRALLTAVAACLALASPAHGDHPAGSSATALDLTKLKVGDGRVSTSAARRGWVFACQSGGQGPQVTGPWISGSYWDLTRKPTVDGSVRWPNATYRVLRSGSKRNVSGNGLPTRHRTGVFPIQQSDDAFQYDRNPNTIGAQSITVSLPANPRKASRPACVPGGAIGILDSGVRLFNALDAANLDAGAHEIQDRCGGHPQQQGSYHYHALPQCLSTGSSRRHSKRIGWAYDGFAIYGPRSARGRYVRNSDLDACHGHTHATRIDGKRARRYHYHATMEYPYTLGCFRGTPVTTGRQMGPPGGPPGPPPF